MFRFECPKESIIGWKCCTKLHFGPFQMLATNAMAVKIGHCHKSVDGFASYDANRKQISALVVYTFHRKHSHSWHWTSFFTKSCNQVRRTTIILFWKQTPAEERRYDVSFRKYLNTQTFSFLIGATTAPGGIGLKARMKNKARWEAVIPRFKCLPQQNY